MAAKTRFVMANKFIGVMFEPRKLAAQEAEFPVAGWTCFPVVARAAAKPPPQPAQPIQNRIVTVRFGKHEPLQNAEQLAQRVRIFQRVMQRGTGVNRGNSPSAKQLSRRRRGAPSNQVSYAVCRGTP